MRMYVYVLFISMSTTSLHSYSLTSHLEQSLCGPVTTCDFTTFPVWHPPEYCIPVKAQPRSLNFSRQLITPTRRVSRVISRQIGSRAPQSHRFCKKPLSSRTAGFVSNDSYFTNENYTLFSKPPIGWCRLSKPFFLLLW